jgi:hypothetical protein
MSKFNFARLREQIRQTNESLKETFKGTDNQLQVIVTRESNNWLENTRKAQESKEWQQHQIEKNRKMAKDPKWLESTTKKNKEMAKDPKWLEANQKGIDKRKQKGEKLLSEGKIEEYRKLFGVKDHHTDDTKQKMSQKASERWAKQMRKVSALGKIYNSIYEASAALGIHKDTVSYRIKTKPKDYFFID